MDSFGKSIIARFSTAFVKNYRISLLLFIGILVLGWSSYATFLTRDGFPAVDVPIVLVQTPYFVNDKEQVDTDITKPIEKAVANVKEVKEIQSTTTENFSNVIVELEETVSTKEGSRLIGDEVRQRATLPDEVNTEFRTFNAGSLDGEHDLIFTLSADKPTKILQEKAEFVAQEVEKSDLVAQANVIKLITQETNPVTGQQFDFQSGFNRVGIRQEGTIKFFPAVSIGVIKRGDTGALELSDAVRERIDEIEKNGHLDGFEITYGGDIAENVRQIIGDLEVNVRNGLIAVLAVLFILISWRASLVAAIFIPTVLAATFLGIFLLGYTLNVIVLFSLILVLGLFVDDAIVVVEAIDVQKKAGLKGINAIYTAIRNISTADIAGTLTTILVFLPMVFISGILGEFIQIIPITVILALGISILIGLTVTPFFASIFINDQKPKPEKVGVAKTLDSFFDVILNGFNKLILYLSIVFSRFVRVYLTKPVLVLLILFATLVWIAVGITFSSKLTFSVFPPAKDSEAIRVFLNFPELSEIKGAEDVSKKAERIILGSIGDHIKQVNYFEASKNSAFINVQLTPMEDREATAGEMVGNLKKEFEGFGKTRVRVEQEGAGPPTDEFQINLRLFSDDQATLVKAAEDVKLFLKDKKLGEDEKVTDVSVDNLENISKVDQRRFAAVRAKISDPNNTALILDLQDEIRQEYGSEKLSSFGLEENDIGFDLGQEGENIESFNSAIFALGVALVLMYILLVLQFNSFSQPFLIFLAIPFTFPLLFPGLFLTDNTLSFFVMLGVIALSGIVVNNTIFLIDFANQARSQGKGIVDSIEEAVQIRFRPIVSTTATTIFALLPLALTNPFWEPLALTIIFGLISSSVLVIVAFPSFYAIVESLRVIRDRIVEKRKAGEKIITISF